MSVHSFWFFRSSVVCGECAVKDFRECGDNKDIVSTGFSMIETGFILVTFMVLSTHGEDMNDKWVEQTIQCKYDSNAFDMSIH